MENLNTTISIEVYYFDMFADRFADLVRKAKKLDVEVPTFEVIKHYTVEEYVNGEVESIKYIDIELSGEYPKFNGWTFLAQLDHVEGLVKGLGEGHHKHIGNTVCEHCNTTRSRNVTYIVKHEDGTEKMVGGSCLKYYCNRKDLTSVANFMSSLYSLEEEYVRSSGYKPTLTLDDVLRAAVVSVRAHGYVGRNSERRFEDMQTSDEARILLFPSTKEARKYAEEMFTKYDSEWISERVTSIVEYIKGTEETTDFFCNLRTIAERGVVSDKSFNLAVAMIPTYERHLRDVEYKAKKKQEQEKLAKSEFVGEVKKRQEFTGTINFITVLSTQYGYTYLHNMVDGDGNVLVWFGSSELGEKGETVKFKGTVKAHNIYNDVKQTVLTRCTLIN